MFRFKHCCVQTIFYPKSKVRIKYKQLVANRNFSSISTIPTDKSLSYIHHVGEQPLKYQTIGGCLVEAANKWPDRTWIVSSQENERLTFSQILEEADKLAVGFLECGLVPGDRVGICSPNSVKWIVTMMAAARAGLVLVSINPAFQEKELLYCLNKVGIKCLIMPSQFKTQNFCNMMTNISPEIMKCKPGKLESSTLPGLTTVVILDNKKMQGTYTFTEIASLSSNTSVQMLTNLEKTLRPDNGCNIQFTSGTTGKPKAAYLSHFNFVNNSFIIGKRNQLSDKHHVMCTQVPLFHAFGLVIVTMASLQHGATVVLPAPAYSPEESLKSIIKENCTILTGTPTMYVDLLNKRREMDIKINPEIAVTGGSPCSPHLFKRMQSELNIKTLKSIYGLTETSASVFQSLRNETIYQATETVGHVQEHIEVMVVDKEGKAVPFGTPGELWTRGYNNMIGYWDDEDKTKDTIDSSKWLKTGDQFILQKDGYGKIVGRLKDVIIRGGENIYPKEIEDFLNSHPGILETHAFGVKDERMGEEICAGVRLKEGFTFDHDSMKKYCQNKIAHYKIPRSKTSDHTSYFHNAGKTPLEFEKIGKVLENSANMWPDRPFVIYEHGSLTFSQLLEKADKFASGLLMCGLETGDRIAICSPNTEKWLISLMAASRIGLITVAINPANTCREIYHCLKSVDVKALVVPSKFYHQNYYEMMVKIAPEILKSKPGELQSAKLPSLKTIITVDTEKLNGVYTFENVMSMNSNYQHMSAIESLVKPNDKFSILFTSGTTGLPKAAVHSHFSYLNNSRNVGIRCELEEYHKVCLQVPFFHAFSLLMTLGSLKYGSTLVIPSQKYDSKLTMKAILEYGCTLLTGTPTMYVDLIKQQSENNINIKSPKIAITAGASCSPQLFKQIVNHLGATSIKSLYGMTEALGVFQSLPNDDMYKSTETVGKVIDHLEIKVVDTNGDVVPIGTPGELLVRGYSNMLGYWEDNEKTSQMINKDNWLRTGDQFVLQEDGYAKITGRIKDMIIRGGENISPKEIEDIINTHPDILETQVFGVSDERMGEEICASVRIRDGSKFSYEQLRSFCKNVLSNYKIPRYLKIVEDFPRTATGKVQKYKLREIMESGEL